MKKICIYGCAILMLVGKANAQKAVVDSSIYYVNGEGTFINVGKKEGTKINFLAAIQSGFQMSQLDSASITSKSNRLSLNLVRFSLTASTLKDKVSFGIATDFTSTTPILEGWIGFSVFNKRGKFILGQRQTHTNNRLAMADERYAQFLGQTQAGKSVDGSVYGGLMQNFVSSTREGGLFFETNFNIKKWRIYPSISITTGEGQNFFGTQPNVGFKYGGRIDVLPFGDFEKNNAFIAHDIYREQKPKLALGFAASYNSKVSSPNGSDNSTSINLYSKNGTADYANYTKVVGDLIFKYKGFALVGEYINGSVSGNELYINSGSTIKLTTEMASAYYSTGSAFNIQSSYILKSGWAIDGRFSSVKPEFELATSLVHQQYWYTFGVNKFIKNNAVKAGINITYIDDSTPIINTKKWIGNLAVQILL